MKWIALPYSESYFEETKYILVTFLPNLRLMRQLSAPFENWHCLKIDIYSVGKDGMGDDVHCVLILS